MGDVDPQVPAPEPEGEPTPEEIAAAILYLCSDQGQTVNGARIPLYGPM